jgi:hypothetical protein
MGAALLAFCAGCAGPPEQSPSATPSSITDQGPDRLSKIAAAARTEGALNLYTTIAEKDLATIVDSFEAKYGIDVIAWRAGTDKVLQRAVAEAAAGRHEMDVVHFGSPEMEALSREGILLPVTANGPRRSSPSGSRRTTPRSSTEGICQGPIRICWIQSGAASWASRPRTRTGSRRSSMSWEVARSASRSFNGSRRVVSRFA